MHKYRKKLPFLYHGFNTRSYLVLDNIEISKDTSVLEVGIGSGAIINLLIGNIKEYYGVDILMEIINILTEKYRFIDSVKLKYLDVCDPLSFLNKSFDVVFSADTLEHVECQQGFFNFIERHLKDNGIAIVIYPNESDERHHGIIWFNNKYDLVEAIENAKLKIINICKIKSTIPHKLIAYYLWKLPKNIIKNYFMTQSNLDPQTFDRTDAYNIIKDGGIKGNILEFYARTITRLARVFRLYEVKPFLDDDIRNKYLLITITK